MTKLTVLKSSLLYLLCSLPEFTNAQAIPRTTNVRARRANIANGGNAFPQQDATTKLYNGNDVKDTMEVPVGAHKNKKDMVAILHVGPKRTGTSTIQIRAQQIKKSLNAGGYFLPGQFVDGDHPANMFRIATCFESGELSGEIIHPIHEGISCLPELVDAVSAVAASGSNVLISAERFSFSSVDVKTLKKELFDPNYKNVEVVIYYRRFYDWLISKWSMGHELPNYCNNKESGPECINLVDFINNLDNVKNQFPDDYTYTVAKRYQEYFDNVTVVNEYNMGTTDAAEYFFCNVLPDATEACEQYIEKEEPVHYAVREPQIYRYLVVSAIELNLLDVKLDDHQRIKEIAELAQFQHEVKNGKSQYNFYPKRCPDDEALDYLLELTLEVEKEMFPKYFRQRGKFEIIRDFNRAKTTKLCSIDTKAVIQEDSEWQTFFKNVKQGKNILQGKN